MYLYTTLTTFDFDFSLSTLKYIITILITFTVCTALFFSCAKWKDPKPYTDPRLTNPYCNDPAAVNYNWGFPGKPDSTVCFYPNSLFIGNYTYHDTIYKDTLLVGIDSFTINIAIANNSKTKMILTGFCGAGIYLTGLPGYQATIDTIIGDTATFNQGQVFCSAGSGDTVFGYITKDRLDSPAVLHFYVQVAADTGTTSHFGSAILKQ